MRIIGFLGAWAMVLGFCGTSIWCLVEGEIGCGVIAILASLVFLSAAYGFLDEEPERRPWQECLCGEDEGVYS